MVVSEPVSSIAIAEETAQPGGYRCNAPTPPHINCTNNRNNNARKRRRTACASRSILSGGEPNPESRGQLSSSSSLSLAERAVRAVEVAGVVSYEERVDRYVQPCTRFCFFRDASS